MAAARQAASRIRSVALARPVARRRGPLRIVGGRRRFSARNAPSRLRSAPPPTSLVACSATPAPDPGCTYASASRRLTRSAPRCAPAAIYRRSTGTVHMRQYGHTSRMHSSPPTGARLLRATAARTLLLSSERHAAAGTAATMATSGTRTVAATAHQAASGLAVRAPLSSDDCLLCSG